MDATGLRPNRGLTETQRAELIKIVDGYYPFGQRKMHPYKIWLSVRKEFIESITPQDLPVTGLFEEAQTP